MDVRVDVRRMCGGCALDMRTDVRGYRDVRARGYRTDIVRICGYRTDIARISHGYSTTEITLRTPSYYSYVCHYPLSESQAPKPVPSFAGCAQPSVMH